MHWRNKARTDLRAGWAHPELELQARNAAKEYHDAIRKQKKAHWDKFPADDANIWQAARYMNPGDRISYAVEEFGLLPTNHFGARKKRSTEQALTLLQEHIYKA